MLKGFRSGLSGLFSQLKDLTYVERLKKLKLPTLVHRRRRGVMIQTFKIIHKIQDVPSERFFTTEPRHEKTCLRGFRPG